MGSFHPSVEWLPDSWPCCRQSRMSYWGPFGQSFSWSWTDLLDYPGPSSWNIPRKHPCSTPEEDRTEAKEREEKGNIFSFQRSHQNFCFHIGYCGPWVWKFWGCVTSPLRFAHHLARWRQCPQPGLVLKAANSTKASCTWSEWASCP